MEEIRVLTEDNVEIAFNKYTKSREEVVIVAPGWCMTKDSKAFKQISEMFFSEYDVYCLDFRGHGKSKGLYTFTSKEFMDLDAVVKYAEVQGYKKIFLAGFSLGGGLVLIYGANYHNVHKIIAVSPYSDFDKIENHMWKKEAWGETFKKFELERFLSIRPDIFPHKKIKPIDIIKDVTVPTLFIAGKKDPTVYYAHTEELYKQADCAKEFQLYEDGIHAEDLYLYNKENFARRCIEWLKK